ncbi:MAG: Gfo/Idh/MocA family oxidoreductase [Verrucomicrobiales bacterium]|nr:Gfo/Idh/MocA family oxidoreductase [Verrucomicrobiales bacterium]
MDHPLRDAMGGFRRFESVAKTGQWAQGGQCGGMTEERELRIGIVGAGRIVKQRHMPGLRALPGIKITAVANSTLESAQRFCAEYAPEAKPFARWEEVVDNEDVDIVWVGATPDMHHDATDFGLRRGKHVFCQARMASTLAEAEGMWEASIRFPELVSAICPAPHGLKGGEVMKKLLADGAIGVPHQALLHSFNAGWLDPEAPLHWRQQMDISGIQILTLGIYVEVLHRWLGQIVEVEARGNVVIAERPGGEVDVPDFLHVLARFRSGLEATLLFSGVAAHAPGDKLWIFGSEGTLTYDFNTDEIQLGKRGEAAMETIPIPSGMEGGWTVERDFIAAVRNPTGPRPKPDFTEGICYMRVVDAINRSLDGDGVVSVG